MPNSTEPMISNYQFGNAEEVDISSTNHQFAKPKALYIGTGGDVKVDMGSNGTGITFKSVTSGSILSIFAIKVYKAGTTADDILGLD